MKIIPIQPQPDTQPVSTDGVNSPSSTGHTDHSRRTFGKNLPSRRTFGKNLPSRRTFGGKFPSRRTF